MQAIERFFGQFPTGLSFLVCLHPSSPLLPFSTALSYSPYAGNRIRLEGFLINHGILKEKNWPNSRCNKSRCTRRSVHSTVPPPLCARLTRFLFAIIGYRLLWPTACSNDQKGTSCAVNKKDGRHEVSSYSRLSQERNCIEQARRGRWGSTVYASPQEMRFIKGRIRPSCYAFQVFINV